MIKTRIIADSTAGLMPEFKNRGPAVWSALCQADSEKQKHAACTERKIWLCHDYARLQHPV